MNLTSRIGVATLILDNLLYSKNIEFVKNEILVVQDFRVVDYSLYNMHTLIQLYDIPQYNTRAINQKKGLGHLENRTKLLSNSSRYVINISMHDLINNFECERDSLYNHIEEIIKHI